MMINKLAINSLTVSSLILASNFGLPEIVNAQQVKVAFFCGNHEGKPATVARAAQGDIPIIVWATEKGGGWTPQKRCETVSQRFQELKNQGKLNYLTTGVANGQKVICSGEHKNCDQLLFTLSDQSKDPDEVLERLLAALTTNGYLIEPGPSDPIYLDLNDYINNFQRLNAVPTNNTTPPVNNTPATGTSLWGN
jgi:Circadian oscillating protein COP23